MSGKDVSYCGDGRVEGNLKWDSRIWRRVETLDGESKGKIHRFEGSFALSKA